MHELSLCAAIASIAEEHADGQPIDEVRVDIGKLRQVVPATLVYCWDVFVSGTALEGSSLCVNHVPARFDCRACGRTTEIDFPVFRCECGSTDVELTGGEELLVTSLELSGA